MYVESEKMAYRDPGSRYLRGDFFGKPHLLFPGKTDKRFTNRET